MPYIETQIGIFTDKKLSNNYLFDKLVLLKMDSLVTSIPYFSDYLKTQNYFIDSSNEFDTYSDYLQSDRLYDDLWTNVVADVIFSDEKSFNPHLLEEIPQYLTSDENLDSFGILTISNVYKENLTQLFHSMIQLSEIKSLVFISKYQNNTNDVILGMMSLEIFLKKLFSQEILANVMYLITLEKNDDSIEIY